VEREPGPGPVGSSLRPAWQISRRAHGARRVGGWRRCRFLSELVLPAIRSELRTARPRADRSRAVRATGDWGFSPLFMTITPSKARLTMNLRLECSPWRVHGGQRAGAGAEGFLRPHDPLRGHLGHQRAARDLRWGRCRSCTMDRSPSGDISCHSSSNSIRVPVRGWVGTRDRITYTAFTPAKPGEPLASDSWSDSPTDVDPGNKTDNDSQLILTRPAPNPIWSS